MRKRKKDKKECLCKNVMLFSRGGPGGLQQRVTQAATQAAANAAVNELMDAFRMK